MLEEWVPFLILEKNPNSLRLYNLPKENTKLKF